MCKFQINKVTLQLAFNMLYTNLSRNCVNPQKPILYGDTENLEVNLLNLAV